MAIPFSKDTNIQEALELDPAVGEAFKKLKLKCLTCVATVKENLADAARYHHIELEVLLQELQKLSLENSPHEDKAHS